jgi:transcriptional regulator with XRE-family HTH domain
MATRVVKVKDVRTSFYVRAGLAKLDTLRVAYLRSLIEAGVQLPPIEVTPDLLLLCGRHRLAAYAELDYEEIPVQVIVRESPAEYIAYAFKDNATASLPPTRDDVRMVLQQLTAAGVTDRELVAMFVPPYSTAYIKQQLEWNRGNARHIKLRAAHNARNDENLTYEVAAARFGVSPDDLRQFARGKQQDREWAVMALHKAIAGMNKSYGARLKQLLKDVESAYQASTLTVEEVFRLLREPQDYAHTILRRTKDAEERFAAEVAVDDRVAKSHVKA